MIKAKYTVVLDTLLKDENVNSEINKAMSSYPLYAKRSKEEYIPSYIPTRDELNNKILNYYKYREIGFETVGRFLDELEISLKEIMPYYNQMFLTVDQDFQMIYNVDYTREHDLKRESDVTSTSSGNSTNNVTDSTTSSSTLGNDNKTVNSKTPQSQIGITAQNIDSVSYADDVTWNKGNNTESGTSNGTSTATTQNNVNGTGTNDEEEKFSERIKGNYGQVSYMSLIRQYRENIRNIEQEIINNPRISELFMLIY